MRLIGVMWKVLAIKIDVKQKSPKSGFRSLNFTSSFIKKTELNKLIHSNMNLLKENASKFGRKRI